MYVRLVVKLRPSPKQKIGDFVNTLMKTPFHIRSHDNVLPEKYADKLPIEIVDSNLKGGRFVHSGKDKRRIVVIHNDKKSLCFDMTVDTQTDIITIVGTIKGDIDYVRNEMVTFFHEHMFGALEEKPRVLWFKPNKKDMCLHFQYRHSDAFVFFPNTAGRSEAMYLALRNNVFTNHWWL